MSELAGEFLYADRYFLVCRGDHPLAQVEQARLRDIARYPAGARSSVRKHLDVALGAAAPVFEVEHLATVTGLVRAGLGVSVVPAMTLFHFGGEDLRIVPLAGRADATAAQCGARGATCRWRRRPCMTCCGSGASSWVERIDGREAL